jgi:hypothetical protein
MREHRINYHNLFIAGWYNPNSSICDDLLEYFHLSEEKAPGRSYVKTEKVLDKKAKDSIDCIIKDPELQTRYIEYLQQSVDLYVTKYPFCNEYAPWTVIETIQIQQYPSGGAFFSWHTERGTMSVLDRHLVFMTYLNDVTDQGETEFYHQNIKVKPEKGLTLIWPADWTFTHRGIASPSQEKFIVTGWFNFYSAA